MLDGETISKSQCDKHLRIPNTTRDKQFAIPLQKHNTNRA